MTERFPLIYLNLTNYHLDTQTVKTTKKLISKTNKQTERTKSEVPPWDD